MADLKEKKAERKKSPEEEALEKKLEAAEARRAAREEAKRIQGLRAKLEAEEEEEAEDELEALLLTHERWEGKKVERGIDFEIKRYGQHLVPYCKPNKAAHDAFQRHAANAKRLEISEVNNFVKRCLIGQDGGDPNFEFYNPIFEEFPGATTEIANDLLEMAKGAAKRRRGK